MFENFDFTDFWDIDQYGYAQKNNIDEPPSDELIAEIEMELGYKLPASYIWLMKQHNGGLPAKTAFPTDGPTSWADDHIAITGIMGIGRANIYSICGEFGSQFMIDEWGYPAIGVAICDCPSAGHDMVFLDYRECGPRGEPKVVHIDQEANYKIMPLADNFEDFIGGLVAEEMYEEEDAFEADETQLPQDLMERIDYWYGRNQHKKIVDTILSLSGEVRTDEVLGQLAVAYNNLNEYSKAIAVLVELYPRQEKLPKFHYRLGYAEYYLAQETEENTQKQALLQKARDAFTSALTRNPPKDIAEDCREFLEWITEEYEEYNEEKN